ncbi:MAG: hypothetical protein ACI9DK_001964 [Vicingaceae bacterium]|jgi:hypothetical protein
MAMMIAVIDQHRFLQQTQKKLQKRILQLLISCSPMIQILRPRLVIVKNAAKAILLVMKKMEQLWMTTRRQNVTAKTFSKSAICEILN